MLLSLLNAASITENIRTIGCTGGGAHKYAKEFQDELDIEFVQLDELQCLIRGMHFALTSVKGECYTYRSLSLISFSLSFSYGYSSFTFPFFLKKHLFFPSLSYL